ncbi:MAG: zinc-ribbon domain-containing protein [Bacilli bacterium]|nr:zinc-ribbon domain-containing protein [Bacilli bacterium]
MYCEFCGKKIDEDAKFCEHCGKKITTHNIVTKEKNPNETKILLIIIFMSIFGFLFYQELKYFNSPESAINHYLKNLKNQNFENILNNLNIAPNDFNTKEMLKKQTDLNENIFIKDFKILQCTYENEKKAKCEINYTTQKNGINTNKTYFLKKNENKRLFLFTDWIIENQDFELIDDWTLYLPKDATGELEGTDLKKYRNQEKDKPGYDAYSIQHLLKGKYNLAVTMNTGISLNKVIKITSNTFTYEFTLKDISEEMNAKIISLGKDIVDMFYQGIIENKRKEELSSNYEISNLLNIYEELKKDIEKNIILKKFDINNLKITHIDMDEEGRIIVTYQMNYHYEFDYINDNEKKTHEGQSNDTFYITIKNTELKNIEKIDSLVSYFSKKY